MSTLTNREELLHALETVRPGLSPREIIEQSSCLVFLKGRAITFNDELACSTKVPVTFECAVKAEPLLAILGKLTEEEVGVQLVEGELRVEGKNRRASITTEAKILLPVHNLELPEADGWTKMDADMNEAIQLAVLSVSKDQAQFNITCVHLTPKFIEGFDNFQITRYRLPTGLEEEVLVRGDSLKHVPGLGMTEFALTKSWMHFRNPAGLVLSCRRWNEDYPDMMPLLKFDGHPVTLPKGLGAAAERASVFSKETADDDQVMVRLKPDKVVIRGQGATGWYSESKAVTYDGPPLEFMIAPVLLVEVIKRSNEATIAEGRLRIDGGKWRYVTALGTVPVAE